MHTPFTTRAKELMELYNGLRLPLLTVDERLDVLLHIKWTVKEFDCNLTRDIVELIDREADMLNRGRLEASLTGLRKRLANLYLQFIETPEFNPEAARFQKVPSELMVRPNVKPLEGASASRERDPRVSTVGGGRLNSPFCSRKSRLGAPRKPREAAATSALGGSGVMALLSPYSADRAD